ncbi:hypothetical protein BLNAU_23897 [Blattamonas nauphoetae]|uniref:Uncharacterized protein n=1 Tax=Blattamonas nauphoetae TaxID=2049346 RepID=A0ABQ9WNW2_9EUKA|nr:hypothetical protein BLNAU_23897 [Blattamonas nauphoetae]
MWQLDIVNVIIKTRCSSQLAPYPVSVEESELIRTLTVVAPFSENAETALLSFVNAPLKRSPPASSTPRELPA